MCLETPSASSTSSLKRRSGVLGVLASCQSKRCSGARVGTASSCAGAGVPTTSHKVPAPPAKVVQSTIPIRRPFAFQARAARRALGAASVCQSPADVAQLVGPAEETRTDHRARHPELRPDCPRCIYHQLHTQWEQGHGCHRHMSGGQEIRTVWLAQRPANLGGVWGLGCLFCSAYSRRPHVKASHRVKTTPKVQRGSTGTRGAWSRFEVQALSQIACRGVRQHADTFTHQLATRAYFAQEPSVVVSGPAGLAFEDAKLFRGGFLKLAIG